MKKRRIFYSFHYNTDNWRAAQVRNIGAIHRNHPVSGNDWETAENSWDDAITTRWIEAQMESKACTIVLVGSETANRKWINHEIERSWNKGMGVVGIRIHGLKDAKGRTSEVGDNPFHYVVCSTGHRLSDIVKCYNPEGTNSQDRYNWIRVHLFDLIEEAIDIRSRHSLAMARSSASIVE